MSVVALAGCGAGGTPAEQQVAAVNGASVLKVKDTIAVCGDSHEALATAGKALSDLRDAVITGPDAMGPLADARLVLSHSASVSVAAVAKPMLVLADDMGRVRVAISGVDGAALTAGIKSMSDDLVVLVGACKAVGGWT